MFFDEFPIIAQADILICGDDDVVFRGAMAELVLLLLLWDAGRLGHSVTWLFCLF